MSSGSVKRGLHARTYFTIRGVGFSESEITSMILLVWSRLSRASERMETALCGQARFQINVLHSISVITYLNVPPCVEMPVGVAESAEMWQDTALIREPSFSPILMPFKKEINQRILLQSVIIGVLDRV